MKKAEEMLPKNEPRGLLTVRITAACSATGVTMMLCTLHHEKTGSELHLVWSVRHLLIWSLLLHEFIIKHQALRPWPKIVPNYWQLEV